MRRRLLLVFRRPLPLLLLLAAASSLGLLLLATRRHLQTRPPPQQQQPPPPSTALARTCGIRGDFSQAQVDAVCAAPAAAGETAPCRVARVDHLDQSGFVPARLRLESGGAIKIFVYPPSDLISSHILRHGGWEGPSVSFMTTALRAWPGSVLVDIGSGVGVFSLHAARVGRRVLAIDANYQNAIRLAKSVHSNAYSALVHVYWNAVTDLPGGTGMHMRLPGDCNLGGGEPAEEPAEAAPAADDGRPPWLADHVRVRAAGLDLLADDAADHLAGATAVFVKLDIEGHEWRAFATGGRLFSGFQVPLVMMEWSGLRARRPDKVASVLRFFASRRYRPYAPNGPRRPPRPLEPRDHLSWPGDVVWARNMSQLVSSWG